MPFGFPGWTLYVDGKFGSDGYTGFGWDNPLRTLQAAHDRALPGTTILIGELEPVAGQSLTITKPNLAFVGNCYARQLGIGAWLNPVSPSATVIRVQASNCTLKNIRAQGGSQFTGIGFDFSGAHNLILDNVWFQGVQDADSNKVFGGTGFRFANSENGRILGCGATDANCGIKIGNEASCHYVESFNAIQNYRDVVAGLNGDNGGGWTWNKAKFTNGGSPSEVTDVVHFGAGSGHHVFTGVDWCEAGPNRVLIESAHNTFIRPVSAPATTFQIDGNDNTFVGRIVNGVPWVVNGTGNVFLY